MRVAVDTHALVRLPRWSWHCCYPLALLLSLARRTAWLRLTPPNPVSSVVAPPLQFGGLVLPSSGPPLSPQHECRTLLAWQQLVLSLAAPALIAAVAETRLWRRHQAERQQCGLPPEGGLQACLYHTLDAWLLQSEWPDFGLMGWLHLAFVVWLLASTLHTLAVLVSQ